MAETRRALEERWWMWAGSYVESERTNELKRVPSTPPLPGSRGKEVAEKAYRCFRGRGDRVPSEPC